MSLDQDLASLIDTEQDNAIDVAMRLLDPKDVVMHTNIKNIKTMNRLKFMIEYTRQTDPSESAFWETLYDAALLHAVSEGRKRSQEVVEIAKATAVNQLLYPDVEGKKKGWLGKK